MAETQDQGERMMTRAAIAFAAYVVLLLLGNARADEHHHAPQDAPIHEQFYSTWMPPDQPDKSCWNRRDCAPVTQVRRTGNRWQALRDGEWLTIPPEKIEQNRDSPDGRSRRVRSACR
jgi:hypothetical protein